MRAPARSFTMVELIAVMTIIAIVMTAVVPALDNMIPSYRLSAGARKVASEIELAQSEAISSRKEYVVAYNLDDNTYWLVLPQAAGADADDEDKVSEPDPNDPNAPVEGALKRPEDDLEHGKPPRDPNAEEKAPGEEELPAFVDRENFEPQKLPDDIEFKMIVVGDEETDSGTVYVSFDHHGTAGRHLVGLLIGGEVEEDKRAEKWISFDPLTRTIEYHEERPQIPTLEPEGEGADPAAPQPQ